MNGKRWMTAAVALLAIFGLTGCSDDDNNPMALDLDRGTAQVRVAHLSPDAQNVDVWVDGSVALSNVPYRAVSEYLALSAGDHSIQVTATGQTDPVIEADVTLGDGVSYTVFARGLVSDGSLDATVLVDDLDQSGQAKIRFVHASPDAPPVDITLTDGTVLFRNVDFTENESLAVGSGAYDLQVRLAGTDTVVLSFGGVAVDGNTNYTVWAIGLVADGSLDAAVTVDAPGSGSAVVDLTPAQAEVRVAHLSPDAPPVDIWVDGAVVQSLRNVPFQTISGYLELAAKTTKVQVFLAGETTNPVIDDDVTLLPGQAYTIAATGLATNGDLRPMVIADDRVAPGASQAKVRFVHTSPDAEAVDVDVAGGPTIFESTAFREATEYLTVDAGTYDLEVWIARDRSLALEVDDVPLDGATNITIFAIGLAGDGSLAALPAIDTAF